MGASIAIGFIAAVGAVIRPHMPRAVEASPRASGSESAWNKDPVFGAIGIQSGPLR
jgi:hypothetical protein